MKIGAPKNVAVTPDLYQYVLDHGAGADPLLDELGAATRAVAPDVAHMVIPREEAALLTFLVRLTGARRIVEVGTFTGSSTIALARGLSGQGQVITCDIAPEWVELGRPYFQRAGVAERIETRVGPARETLRKMPTHPHIDLAFIDADKPGYIDYWEELVPRVRPNGLLVVDNTLFSGDVLSPVAGSKGEAVHAFNEHAVADRRTEIVMLPIADGLTLARRLDVEALPLGSS